MGRPGAGGGGGGRSSSGHSFSSSRSTSGHSMSSRSRPSSSFSRANTHMSPGMSSYGGYHSGYHGNYYGGVYSRSPDMGLRGCLSAIISFVFIAFVAIFILVLANSTASGGGVPASTANREKISAGIAYQNDCVVDELNWIDRPAALARELQTFYDKTGIQPYIVLKDWQPSLATESDKDAYANQYYDEHIDNEGTLLYMYFAEQSDNDVGYMTLVNGREVTTVMDAEAVEIFWAYLDSHWYRYDSNSTGDMFAAVFNDTAARIMQRSTTGADVAKIVTIVVLVVVAGVVVVSIMKTKRTHEKERNAETERILNTPLHPESSSSEQEVLDKWS